MVIAGFNTDNLPGSFTSFWEKVLDNLSGFKCWIFLLPFIVSTIFLGVVFYFNMHDTHAILAAQLNKDHMDLIVNLFKNLGDIFIAWCSFNVSLAGIVVTAREYSKTQIIKASTNNTTTETTNS